MVFIFPKYLITSIYTKHHFPNIYLFLWLISLFSNSPIVDPKIKLQTSNVLDIFTNKLKYREVLVGTLIISKFLRDLVDGFRVFNFSSSLYFLSKLVLVTTLISPCCSLHFHIYFSIWGSCPFSAWVTLHLESFSSVVSSLQWWSTCLWMTILIWWIFCSLWLQLQHHP